MVEDPKTSRYLAGWEVDFSNRKATVRFIRAHAISKKGFDFFTEAQAGLELVPKSDDLFDCYEHMQGQITIKAESIKLPLKTWEDREAFLLRPSPKGPHQIGGKPPARWVAPQHKSFKCPFIYLGFISGKDDLFRWLNVSKLHISYPIYELTLPGIYLDVSDPLRPKVMNGPRVYSPDWLTETSLPLHKIAFKARKYSASMNLAAGLDETRNDLLLCGVPLWLQAPTVPTCPRTGEAMRFVCYLKSNPKMRVADQALRRALGRHQSYPCFGDMGYLYVFYHPRSQIMHLQTQF